MTVLDIQNVKQKSDIEYTQKKVQTNKNFGSQLRHLIIDQKQETLPDGKIEITMVLDPKITEKK